MPGPPRLQLLSVHLRVGVGARYLAFARCMRLHGGSAGPPLILRDTLAFGLVVRLLPLFLDYALFLPCCSGSRG